MQVVTTAQEVKRVPYSEELLHPGDFVFIPKREAVKRFESIPIEPPASFFARLRWRFGKKFALKPVFDEVSRRERASARTRQNQKTGTVLGGIS